MLKKFNFSDIFINRIKTYPKTRILTHSGSMYYNNSNSTESGISVYDFLMQPIVPEIVTDQYYDNVVLLLMFEGADGTTTITDSSNSNHAMSIYQNVQIDTSQSKIGLSSALYDGSLDSVYTNDSSDFIFGVNDFTVETYVRFNVLSLAALMSKRYDNLNFHGYTWFVDASTMIFVYYTADYGARNTLTASWAPVTDTWYHVAICRSGSDFRFFVDGVQIGTTSNVSTDNFYSSPGYVLRVGSSNQSGTNNTVDSLNGWLDCFRITKGIARYTDTFSPPLKTFLPPP